MQVCFPLEEQELSALRTIASAEQLSDSEVARRIVLAHLDHHAQDGRTEDDDRRKYQRKPSQIPVVIQIHYSNENNRIMSGVILDISVGGVKISLPKGSKANMEILEDSSHLEILFRFPEEADPAIFTCLPKRADLDNDELHIGAVFVDGKFSSQQALYRYIM
jgi:hypothetical protein